MTEEKLIGGRYVLGRRLGRGGMASVYVALDKRLHRDVAVKLLESYGTSEDTQVFYFHREARAVAALRHANIVQIYDYSGPDERPSFIVMELVDGDTINHSLEPDPPESVLLSVLHGVASALAHAHDHGVVHRDIKPSNVMLEADGRVVLTDFGVAKAYQDPKRLGDTLSGKQTGIVATPEFMAPEQVRDKAVSPATDVFSLGALAYFLAVGRSPFANTELVEVLRSVLDCDYEPLPKRRPDLSDSFGDLIRSCLVVDQDQRPTASAFASHCLTLLGKSTNLTTQEVLRDTMRGSQPRPAEVVPTLVAPKPTSRESGRIRRNALSSEQQAHVDPSQAITNTGTQDVTAPMDDLAADATAFIEPTVRHQLEPPPQPAGATGPNKTGAFLLGFLLVTFAGVASFAWWKQQQTPAEPPPAATVTEVPAPPPTVVTAPIPTGEPEKPQASEREPPPAKGASADENKPAKQKDPPRRPRTPKDKRRARAKAAPTPPVPTPPTAAEVVTVRLVVKPWGTVFVDGKRRGNTPILRMLELTAGLHLFRVEHPQLGSVRREVTLAPGKETTLRFEFDQP